jgi:hypothetical protein
MIKYIDQYDTHTQRREVRGERREARGALDLFTRLFKINRLYRSLSSLPIMSITQQSPTLNGRGGGGGVYVES